MTDLQEQVFERDGWKCRACGAGQGLHVHHIIFRSQGGLDTLANLLTLCFACHESVHRHEIKILPEEGSTEPDANVGIILEFKLESS